MCSLCGLPVAKTHDFWQMLTFRRLVYRPPFTDEGQIGCAVADPRYRPTLNTCQISSPSLYYVALWRRNNAVFWASAFCGVASWRQSGKVEHGCTTTNLSLSSGIKIVSVLQRLHGEIGRKSSDVQKRDGQTDRQTKTLNVFGHSGGG